MKYLLSLLLILLAAPACAASTVGPTTSSVTSLDSGGTGMTTATFRPTGSGKIVVFGDSLTFGTSSSSCASAANLNNVTPVVSLTGTCWADKIGVFFNMPVLNAGNAGAPLEHCISTTTGGCTFAGIDIYSANVTAKLTANDYVIVMFGTNDANYKLGTGSGATPGDPTFTPANFYANYNTMVTSFLGVIPKSHIALMTTVWRNPGAGIKGNVLAFVSQFNEMTALSAIKNGVFLIDQFGAINRGAVVSGSYLRNNQLIDHTSNHPNDNGYAVMAAAIENPIMLTPWELYAASHATADALSARLVNTSQFVPSVSSCGSSPAIDANADAYRGKVTVGSGTVASCTVTFNTAYQSWNHCIVEAETPSISDLAYSYSNSAIVVTASSLTSIVFDYSCDGY